MNCSEVVTGFGVMLAAVILTDIDHHPANEYFRRNRVREFEDIRSRFRRFHQRTQRLCGAVVNNITVPRCYLRAVHFQQLSRCVGQREYLPDTGSQLRTDVFFLPRNEIQFWTAFHFNPPNLLTARRWIRNTELDHVGRIPYLECIPHYGHIPSIG